MHERRIDTRLLCADLVELIWVDEAGQEHRRIGNLEDISLCGMCLQLEAPLLPGCRVRALYNAGELSGVVRYAVFRDGAHFVGVELDADSTWSAERFVPQHLLDPRDLLHRVLARRRGAQSGSSLIQ
ncbi:MAG TPA: hypothetical protein VHZ55_10955 [Bryobacteraceae bacterium]|nr:hypothetical protein [Bryobacteraceae bacterium]